MKVAVSRSNEMWRVERIDAAQEGEWQLLITPKVSLAEVTFVVVGTPRFPFEHRSAYLIGEMVDDENPLSSERASGRHWGYFGCFPGGRHVFRDAYRSTPIRECDMVVLGPGRLQMYLRDRWDI